MLTPVQKFLFDLNGFLVLESVLPPEQCERLKRQVYLMEHDPEKLPPHARSVPGGELAELIDHPVVTAALHEIIGPYLRLDHAYVLWREMGQRHPMDLHHGGPIPDPFFHYHFTAGHIRAGLTRVVFELNDVEAEDGGTCFLPGSHKAGYPVPPELQSLEPGAMSPFVYRSRCPAGSVILFSENTAHGGPPWRNPRKPRVAVFFSYNHVGMQFHRFRVAPEVLASLSDRQRAYLRDVWVHDFETHRDNSGEPPSAPAAAE
jgi:ectoine hydroxylase-related dioxygenase (phytanoyl-CoA dioxygenase family)